MPTASLFYNLVYTKTFSDQLHGLPKPARLQVVDKALGLQNDPRPHGDVKKKLHGYQGDIYRLRSGSYRVIYSFGDGFVQLLGVDDRKDVYKKDVSVEELGFDPSDLPDDALVAIAKPRRRPRRRPPTVPAPMWEPAPEPSSPGPPSPLELPRGITLDLVRSLRIPARYIGALLKCKTVEDLILAPVPEELRDRVFNAVSTPIYDEVAQDAMYHGDPADLVRHAEGDLVTFLLKLDQEQEKYVNWSINGAGPNLLKGGPGTGKSIVAIYRTRAVIRELRKFGIAQPRVLFTSYTNALVNSSRQLLLRLLGQDMNCVTVCTADSLVAEILKENGHKGGGAPDGVLKYETHVAREMFEHGSPEDQKLASLIAHVTNDYLSEEIDRVIVGRELSTLDSYLEENRSGRRVRLSENQRRAVWRFARVRQERLTKKNQRTFAENRRTALDLVRAGRGIGQFDAVIIDEAQDLDPTVIRLLMALCKSPDRLFLTADANQSIYGCGFRWADVHSDLKFQGRTGVLRRNYRSTKQIEAAAAAYLAGAEIDNEFDQLASTDCVRSGEAPYLIWWRDHSAEISEIVEFIGATTRDLHVGLGSCAVLVPENSIGSSIAHGLSNCGLPAKFMESQAVNLEEPVVKVLTMHSAKGLEFPVVAVAGFWPKSKFLQLQVSAPEDEAAEAVSLKRRVVHVAMTRAMRELAVVVPADHPSPLLTSFDDRYWAIEDADQPPLTPPPLRPIV